VNIVIVGAGAIGGYLGTRLALQGHAVSAIARGATQAALKQHGWRASSAEQVFQAPLAHSAERGDALLALLGGQTPDVVIIALKSFALPELAPHLSALIGPETVVLSAMNGVPWWFFDGFGGPAHDMALPSVDPDRVIAKSIPTRNVLACVVHMTCSTPEPGVAKHGFGDRLIIGELNGELNGELKGELSGKHTGASSERAGRIAAALGAAGFDAPVVNTIRRDVWFKLWGNLNSNPISALTRATMDRLLADPQAFEYCLAIMREAAALGDMIGCPITQSGEERLGLAKKLGAFKTSMLQDCEAGRRMEWESMVQVVHDIGLHLNYATPFVDSLLGMIRLLDGYNRGHERP
jgi:2-dehydropantoate 2-reductase